MGFDIRWSDKLKIASTVMEKIMSVSMSDTPASASSTADLSSASSMPEAKASRSMPTPQGLNGQNNKNVSFMFHEGHGGPVFGNHQPPTDRQGQSGHLGHHHHSAPVMPSFMESFKQWMNQWFAAQRPPMRPDCNGTPPSSYGGYGLPPSPHGGYGNLPSRPYPSSDRPYPSPPGRPDPQYALKTNEQLAQQLRNNFSAFTDPKKPGYVSGESIFAMARKGWSPNPITNANIRLANELLRRPDLMSALDRHASTGALDGLIDRQNVGAVITGGNAFKYKTDKQLAWEMLQHFSALKDSRWDGQLSFNELRAMGAQSLTGYAPRDHVIQLAQEVLKRSDVLRIMDNLSGRQNDNRISWQALYALSR